MTSSLKRRRRKTTMCSRLAGVTLKCFKMRIRTRDQRYLKLVGGSLSKIASTSLKLSVACIIRCKCIFTKSKKASGKRATFSPSEISANRSLAWRIIPRASITGTGEAVDVNKETR